MEQVVTYTDGIHEVTEGKCIAKGDATVVASGDAEVWAFGNAEVEAYDNAEGENAQ